MCAEKSPRSKNTVKSNNQKHLLFLFTLEQVGVTPFPGSCPQTCDAGLIAESWL